MNRIPMFKPPDPSGKAPEVIRREDNTWYNSTAWRKCRDAYLKAHPLCVRCQAEGILTVAQIVHHVIERKNLDDPMLAYDWENLESLCRKHHTSHHNTRHEPG